MKTPLLNKLKLVPGQFNSWKLLNGITNPAWLSPVVRNQHLANKPAGKVLARSLHLLFSKWEQVAGLLLIGGALAWALKLGIIISTNGRIIDTGAAAVLMSIGLVMLFVGSTGIGYRLSLHLPLLLRIIAIMLSPAVVFSSFLLFAKVAGLLSLFKNSGVWYAHQESPIALAVLAYLVVGYFLLRSNHSPAH